jgi:hypothetical protein
MGSNLARWKLVVVAAVMMLLAAACGSSGTASAKSSTSATAPAATRTSPADSAACRDVAALQASVQKLVSYQPGKDTIASLRVDVSDANAKLSALRQSSPDTWSTQRGPLQVALRNLQDEVTGSVGTGKVAGILSALGVVRTRAQNLFDVAKAQCPEL